MIPAGEHPAAPEGETKASGLTEDEKAPLRNTIRDVIGRPYGFDAICRQVERIVAERLRVVEGERDQWRGVAIRRESLHDQIAEVQAELAVTAEVRDVAQATSRLMQARAESAEAAHAALVAGVEALADEWERTHLTGFCSRACDSLAHANKGRFVADLRGLLAGDNQ